ncbi:MAG: hypothetical protein ACK5HO_03910 [Pseudomonadota bacterium]
MAENWSYGIVAAAGGAMLGKDSSRDGSRTPDEFVSADGDKDRALGGLAARDLRRNRGAQLVKEPPIPPHSVVMLGERGGLLHGAREVFRSLICKPTHALPPRIWYRLDSMGRSYAERQWSEPFTLRFEPLRGGCVIWAPPALCDQVQQVLVVSRRVRLVLEVASRMPDHGWLIRGVGAQQPRHAYFVFACSAGESLYLPCAAVSKVITGQ